MSERNGKHTPPPTPNPMLRAVGEVVAKELGKRDETIKALEKRLTELPHGPPAVNLTNHVDSSPLANAICLIAKDVRESVTFQKQPQVNFDLRELTKALSDVVAEALKRPPAAVEFDLSQLTREIGRVVEMSLDQPMPAVSVPTERLEQIISDALTSPRMPEVRVDLSELSAGLTALALSQQRTAEAMESVAALLQALSGKINRLEERVNTPRPPRKLHIVHEDGTESNIEEIT